VKIRVSVMATSPEFFRGGECEVFVNVEGEGTCLPIFQMPAAGSKANAVAEHYGCCCEKRNCEFR
jgi:hypothetical protein